MPDGDPPSAQGDSATGHRGHVEDVKRRANSDNVSDRIPTPYLVEVDLASRYPVHSTLRLGEPQEYSVGSLADQVRQVRSSQQCPNIGPAAIRLILGHRRHVDFGRAQPGPGYNRASETDRLRR